MVRCALRVQYPHSNAIVLQSFSPSRLSSPVSGAQCESSGLLSAPFCVIPQRGFCWWLILETRSTGLSALRARWRVTGPGWPRLKCVKTRTMIKLFGKASKKVIVFVFFIFYVFFPPFSGPFLICFGCPCCYRVRWEISDNETHWEDSLVSAANHRASFNNVVTVDGDLLCSCISLSWLPGKRAKPDLYSE